MHEPRQPFVPSVGVAWCGGFLIFILLCLFHTHMLFSQTLFPHTLFSHACHSPFATCTRTNFRSRQQPPTTNHTSPSSFVKMQLIVRAEQTHVMEVEASTCVSDIRSFVEAAEGIPAEEQYVTYAGRPIVDGPLSAFNVSELATVTVSPRLRGGTMRCNSRRRQRRMEGGGAGE